MCNSSCPSCATFSTFTASQRSTGASAGKHMVSGVTEGCWWEGGCGESAGGRSNRGFRRLKSLRSLESVAGSPNDSDKSRTGLFSLYRWTSRCSPYILWRSEVLLKWKKEKKGHSFTQSSRNRIAQRKVEIKDQQRRSEGPNLDRAASPYRALLTAYQSYRIVLLTVVICFTFYHVNITLVDFSRLNLEREKSHRCFF